MNNEQLEEWLSELHERLCPGDQHNQNEQAKTNGFYAPSTSTVQEEAQAAGQPSWRAMLQQFGPQTNMLLNYFLCNFDDSRLAEPLLTQLLSLYYKFGVSRCFVMQLVPTFIHAYLKALAKRWSAPCRMLEMFFLALYNEEILAQGPGTPSMAKRSDEVRLPSLRLSQRSEHAKTPTGNNTFPLGSTPVPSGAPTIASSAVKIQVNSQPETISLSVTKSVGGSQVRLFGATPSQTGTAATGSSGVGTSIQKTFNNSVRIGPFPAIERIIAENRFVVLTRLMRTFNQLLPKMPPEVACRALAHSLLYICRSGFSYRESDFRQRVLREAASNEVFADFARKSRIRNVPSSFLLESINGLTFALLNGQADISLRALDAIHQRAQYELMPDVLLETNALRHALSDSCAAQAFLMSNANDADGQKSTNLSLKKEQLQQQPVFTIDNGHTQQQERRNS